MSFAILREFRDLTIDGEESDRLVKAAQALLRRQFIWAGDASPGLGGAYATIVDRRWSAYFEALVEPLGYRFLRDEAEQWVGILPDHKAVKPERVLADETLVLLLLGLVWQESINEGEVGPRGVVETTSAELFERYAGIASKDRIKEPRFREILDELRRKGVVQVIEQDEESLEFRIEIRPVIRFVAGEVMAERVKDFVADRALDLDRAESSAAAERDGERADDAEGGVHG